MKPGEIEILKARALRVREQVLRLAGRGGCFVGASLSCADILVHLYSRILRITPDTLSDPARDYLFLSKGHDVPALYATLAELAFVERRLLDEHLKPGSGVYWHPSRAVAGVEFHSGSLGHLLSVAIGVALDVKLRGGPNRVFVLLGDGELNEGSVWEACLVASALRLGNLTAIVDRNGFQANARTEDLIPLEPLALKFDAFGWTSLEIDGHRFEDLEGALAGRSRSSSDDQPTMIVAHTRRGCGVPSLENRIDRWFATFRPEEVEALVGELHGGSLAALTSAGSVVR